MSEQQPPLPPNPATELAGMTTSERFHAMCKRLGEAEMEVQLLDAIVSGKSLNKFCEDNVFSYTTVLRWIRKLPERSQAYDDARRDRADIYADRVVEVAERDCSAPVVDKDGNFLGTVVDKGKVAQARNEMDALKWQAARMNPKVWGDKIEVDNNLNVREASDDQLAAALGRYGLGSVAERMLQLRRGTMIGGSDSPHGAEVH